MGHIDTVPGEIPVRITKGDDPDVTVLYGRGSVDAKGPLAAFVDAVAEVGVAKDTEFIVIGCIDEERQSLGARGIVDHYQPDFAVIGEPSQWDQITLGYKGSAWANARVQRTMAHTAGKEQSAPETAVEFWIQVITWAENFNADRERAFEQVIPTLRGFSSGGDAFVEWATLNIGVRLPIDLDPSQWYKILQDLGVAADVEVMPVGFPVSAYRAERNTALVRSFLGGIRSAGGKPRFVVKTGTADLNIVAPLWHCPAVAYGPGDSSLDHTPQEHIVLEEYQKAVKVLTDVLRRLSAEF
jgi:LysW-gamma-L-lysine carboxypeptidase